MFQASEQQLLNRMATMICLREVKMVQDPLIQPVAILADQASQSGFVDFALARNLSLVLFLAITALNLCLTFGALFSYFFASRESLPSLCLINLTLLLQTARLSLL